MLTRSTIQSRPQEGSNVPQAPDPRPNASTSLRSHNIPLDMTMNVHEFLESELKESIQSIRRLESRNAGTSLANSDGFDPKVVIDYIPRHLADFLDKLASGGCLELRGSNGRYYGMLLSASESCACLAFRSGLAFAKRMSNIQTNRENIKREIPELTQKIESCSAMVDRLFKGWEIRASVSWENQALCDAKLVPFFIDDCGVTYTIHCDYPISNRVFAFEHGAIAESGGDCLAAGLAANMSISRVLAAIAEHSSSSENNIPTQGTPPYSLMKHV